MYTIADVMDSRAREIAVKAPNLSEAEVNLGAIRYALLGLAETLHLVYQEGTGLSNEAVFAIGMGVMEMLDWILAKDMADMLMSEIENL